MKISEAQQNSRSMKLTILFLVFFLIISFIPQHTTAQVLKKIVLDEKDALSGHYLLVEPEKKDSISGVLILLAGFGQIPENTLPETKLHQVAYANQILTIFYAGGNKLYLDSIAQVKLSRVLMDVCSRYKVKSNSFVLGGYSAGGMLAVRYVELVNDGPVTIVMDSKDKN